MLTFNLKKEWFDKIKSGEKTHEYRKYDYWYPIIIKKLKIAESEGRPLTIKFMLGYNIKPEQRAERIMYAEVINVRGLWGNGHETDGIPTPCVDIKFKLVGNNHAKLS